jgi:hypothetical protein
MNCVCASSKTRRPDTPLAPKRLANQGLGRIAICLSLHAMNRSMSRRPRTPSRNDRFLGSLRALEATCAPEGQGRPGRELSSFSYTLPTARCAAPPYNTAMKSYTSRAKSPGPAGRRSPGLSAGFTSPRALLPGQYPNSLILRGSCHSARLLLLSRARDVMCHGQQEQNAVKRRQGQ